jgi:hypothetical protein
MDMRMAVHLRITEVPPDDFIGFRISKMKPFMKYEILALPF